MKKLYILAFSLFTLNVGFSQCDIDQSTTDNGLSPDNLTSGCVDSEVNRSLTITLPNKYNYQGTEVTGNKVTLVSVTNLPTGIEEECLDVNCEMLLPNAINRSCIGINGTPTSTFDSEITITLRVHFTANIGGIPVNSTIDSVYNVPIQIHAANSPECLELSNDFFEIEEESFTVAPNPINAASSLNINLNQASKASIEVFDILGKETVTLFNGSLDAGYQEIPLSKLKDNLDSGIYLVKIFLEDSNETIIKKVYVD